MLGNKIKKLRNDKGLTQKQLADKLEVAQSTIGMIERNERGAGNELLVKFSDFFNVSTDYLLGKDECNSLDKNKSVKNTLPIVPEEFTNPEEARAYVDKHQIFGSSGFDADNLSDDEILEFANELLRQMEIISYKYKK